eukprot:scaffold2401_cov111-Cylindrotheca_fusiformis.AAC.6
MTLALINFCLATVLLLLAHCGATVTWDDENDSPSAGLRGAPREDSTRSKDLKTFKRDHLLLEDAVLPRQRVSAAGIFEVNGKQYTLGDLEPANVFGPNATLMEDGVLKSLESADARRSRLFTSKGGEGESFLVVKEGFSGDETGGSGMIRSIDMLNVDGSEVYMESLSDGTLVTIRGEDRDRQKLDEFSIGPIKGEDDEVVLLDQYSGHHRDLQEYCASYKVIEVAIAYDSTFCSTVAGGSSSQARERIEQIVARTSLLYEPICVRVRLSHLEGYCTAALDPYVQVVRYNNIGCGITFGALQAFRNYWNMHRQNIRRDAAHLFFGRNLPGGAIGCASRPALCNSLAYGANEMSFTSDIQLQANLFAHELGHNAGAPHLNDRSNQGNFIMEPSLNSATSGFSSQSKKQIQGYLNSKSCIASEDRGDGNNNDGNGIVNTDNDNKAPEEKDDDGIADPEEENDDDIEDPKGDDDDSESSYFRLESYQYRGYCLQILGQPENGTPVALLPCYDKSTTQNWSWDKQTHLMSSLSNTNKCLFPTGAARRGGRLVIWDCDPSYSYAAWSYYGDNSLRPDSVETMCIDVMNSDGTTLQMWYCNGTDDKKWLVRG